MPTISLDYRPTVKQKAFHASKANEVLYGGAAGGGKSYAICWDAFIRCMKYPKTSAYLFRRTFPELEQTIIKTMREIVPPGLGRYVGSIHRMTLINGSEINFCHLTDESTVRNYYGAEIHWLYFDELTHFSKAMYDTLKTRLRANKKLGIVPCVRCASNPGSSGHAWVKSYFVDATNIGTSTATKETKDIDGTIHRSTIEYIPATVRDNPYIGKDYIRELLQKPKKLREALLEGKWDAFEGQAFPEFMDEPEHYADGIGTHVIEPFDPPLHWPRYISFDHGYSRPFSFGVWTVDEDGRVYRYKELYGCVDGEPNTGLKIPPEEIADRMIDLLAPEFREGIRVQGIADPAIWDRSRGPSIEDMFRDATTQVVFRRGDNTRMAGKMQLHERLKFDEDGRPMLYVTSNCKDFIRTIPALAYDPRKVEDIDTAGEDHIYDETRYFLMSRPIDARPLPQKKVWIYNPLD